MLSKEQTEAISNMALHEAIELLCRAFPGRVSFSTSFGQEDQVILHCIATHRLPVRIFTIDTGRMFNETYELFDRTVARYQLPIEVFVPEASDVEAYVATHGMNGFYESVELRKNCCHIRKVKPLDRALRNVAAWITGLRGAQSTHRENLPLIEWSHERQLYKYNPLIKWSYDDLLSYISDHDVPCSRLHQKGFLSIGCAPCTRAIAPGEDIRAGRWWWESTQKECGLHSIKQLTDV